MQSVLVPIAQQKENVLEVVKNLQEKLSNKYSVELDQRSEVSPGFKFNYWELRGVPVRIEIGPRDIENEQCVVVRRDTLEKQVVKLKLAE